MDEKLYRLGLIFKISPTKHSQPQRLIEDVAAAEACKGVAAAIDASVDGTITLLHGMTAYTWVQGDEFLFDRSESMTFFDE